MKIIKIILFLILIILPTVCADQIQQQNAMQQNAMQHLIQQEIFKGNKIILDKIQSESDMCYQNIEKTSNSYFYSLREDFKIVFWTDRIVSFIGMFISFLLAFLVAYAYIRKAERRKDSIQYSSKQEPKTETKIVGGNVGK